MRGDEFVLETRARDHQHGAAAVQRTVKSCLHGRSRPTVVDPTRRLVDHRREGPGRPRQDDPWRDERGGDAVDDNHVARRDPQGIAQHARGYELDACIVGCGAVSHAPVVQVTTGELVG